MRPTCFKCLRTLSDCYCGQIRSFASGPRFAILQHPKETRNRVGTARMASLCLSNSELIRGELDERELRVRALLSNPGNFCVLLYPGKSALDLAAFSEEERFDGKQLVIFVVDATWSMAKKMVRLSEALMSLPRIAFSPQAPSGYLFRKQPRPQFVSTIEAIHEVIDVLDRSGAYPVSPPGAHGNLIEVFGWMARRQAAYSTESC